MRSNKLLLNEDVYSPNTVFVDSTTGKQYKWTGDKFVQIKPGKGKSGDDKGRNSDDPFTPEIGNIPDDEESKRIEDEENKAREAEEDEEEETEEEVKARIDRIKDLLNDEETMEKANDEAERQVFKSRQRKTDAERKKQLKQYRDSHGIEGFIVSINDFIKNEVKDSKIRSYKKMNKTYNTNAGSSIIRQGRMKKKNDKIPMINVYYDQSGSWGPSWVEMGNAAIATLNKYVEKKQLIIDVYYFADRISATDNSEEAIGRGTSAGDKIVAHINETRPDNVVIMTDSDIDHYVDYRDQILGSATVPGGVWYLWKNGEKSRHLFSAVKGRKLTKEFNVTKG